MANDLLDLDSAMVKTPGGKHAMGVSNVDTALDVLIQDNTNRPVDFFLTNKLADITIAAPAVVED